MQHDMFVYFKIFVHDKTKEVNQQKNTNYLPAFSCQGKVLFSHDIKENHLLDCICSTLNFMALKIPSLQMKKAIPSLLHPMGRVKNLLFHTRKEAEFHTAEDLKTNKSLSSYIANFTKKKKSLYIS